MGHVLEAIELATGMHLKHTADGTLSRAEAAERAGITFRWIGFVGEKFRAGLIWQAQTGWPIHMGDMANALNRSTFCPVFPCGFYSRFVCSAFLV